jgi:hypothetical protein
MFLKLVLNAINKDAVQVDFKGNVYFVFFENLLLIAIIYFIRLRRGRRIILGRGSFEQSLVGFNHIFGDYVPGVLFFYDLSAFVAVFSSEFFVFK